MLYVRTYVRTCTCSQGVRKVVKREGAGTQTIRNLGIKERAIKSAIYGIIQLYTAQWITSHVCAKS